METPHMGFACVCIFTHGVKWHLHESMSLCAGADVWVCVFGSDSNGRSHTVDLLLISQLSVSRVTQPSGGTPLDGMDAMTRSGRLWECWQAGIHLLLWTECSANILAGVWIWWEYRRAMWPFLICTECSFELAALDRMQWWYTGWSVDVVRIW